MPNAILSTRTLHASDPTLDSPTIAIATDVNDVATLEPFVVAVSQQFKVYRTSCPAGEYNLLITVIGTNCAEVFSQLWKELVNEDPILKLYTKSLANAEVLVGTSSGEIIESASLLS